jgi:hypothetical protein
MREEYALIDLNAILVALRMSGLGNDLLARRDQSGEEFRGGVDEVVEAQEDRATLGQKRIYVLRVGREKRLARGARNRQ